MTISRMLGRAIGVLIVVLFLLLLVGICFAAGLWVSRLIVEALHGPLP